MRQLATVNLFIVSRPFYRAHMHYSFSKIWVNLGNCCCCYFGQNLLILMLSHEIYLFTKIRSISFNTLRRTALPPFFSREDHFNPPNNSLKFSKKRLSFLLKFISLAKSDSILLRHVNNNLKINFQINIFNLQVEQNCCGKDLIV